MRSGVLTELKEAIEATPVPVLGSDGKIGDVGAVGGSAEASFQVGEMIEEITELDGHAKQVKSLVGGIGNQVAVPSLSYLNEALGHAEKLVELVPALEKAKAELASLGSAGGLGEALEFVLDDEGQAPWSQIFDRIWQVWKREPKAREFVVRDPHSIMKVKGPRSAEAELAKHVAYYAPGAVKKPVFTFRQVNPTTWKLASNIDFTELNKA